VTHTSSPYKRIDIHTYTHHTYTRIHITHTHTHAQNTYHSSHVLVHPPTKSHRLFVGVCVCVRVHSVNRWRGLHTRYILLHLFACTVPRLWCAMLHYYARLLPIQCIWLCAWYWYVCVYVCVCVCVCGCVCAYRLLNYERLRFLCVSLCMCVCVCSYVCVRV